MEKNKILELLKRQHPDRFVCMNGDLKKVPESNNHVTGSKEQRNKQSSEVAF